MKCTKCPKQATTIERSITACAIHGKVIERKEHTIGYCRKHKPPEPPPPPPKKKYCYNCGSNNTIGELHIDCHDCSASFSID